MMELVDGHAHLEEIPDLKTELGAASEAGVVAVVAVGSDLGSNLRVLEISKQFGGFVFPALGLHPWSLGERFGEELRFIEENIGEAVALGEVGMDLWIKKERGLQRRAFEGVLELAERYSKPLILHTRGAWRECFELVKNRGVDGVFHWYSGPLDLLKEVLDRGFYISATPAAEYSEPHRKALREVPVERLVLETDAPVSYRGASARPKDVVKTLRAVARLKELPEEEVARLTTQNAKAIFGLPI